MPDISKLPLMPGDDTLRPEDRAPAPVPATTATAPQVPADWNEDSGCDCPVCREVRYTRAAQAVQVGAGPNRYRLGRFLDEAIPDLGAQAFQTVTGRSRAGEPAMQYVPLPTTRIRGRYDFANTDSAANGMQDQVRWLEPGTLQVWDSPTGGRPQWTYSEILPDGSLVDHRGRRWRPTEV